jgi:threonine/homoserine/homoserine lactone efflux protein
VGPANKQMSMKKNIVLALSLTAPALAFFLTGTAFAQTDPNAALCGGDALSQLFCSVDLTTMLNSVFQLSITLGGVLAMLRIGYAGYLYMGREDMWSTKQHAKEVFRDAIIGLLILLAIWLILNQINPDILKLQFLQSAA